jgi:hypothetical protein
MGLGKSSGHLVRTTPKAKNQRWVRDLERSRLCDCCDTADIVVCGLAAMSDAEQPTPELYREAAERVRQLAQQSRLPDIQADLLDLAARFERMAAYFEAASTPGGPRRPPEN